MKSAHDASSTIIEIADGIVETTRDWPVVPDGIYAARYVRHECVVAGLLRARIRDADVVRDGPVRAARRCRSRRRA